MVIMARKVTFEEAYPIIEGYVQYFYRSGKFYSLRWHFEEEDMLQEVCTKFLQNGYLERYDENVTTLKYFLMTGVKFFFIDCLRKQKQTISLDREFEEGLTMLDLLVDESSKDLDDMVIYKEWLDRLPDDTNSKIIITTEYGGKATLRNIAMHLSLGYTQAELRKYMINPANNKPVTSGRLSQLVKEIKDVFCECGLEVF